MNKVISEMLEASLIISSQVLNTLDIDPRRIEQQLDEIRQHKQGMGGYANPEQEYR